MKLSMWIVADWLKDFESEHHIISDSFDIDTIRFYSGSDLSDNTLYLGEQDKLFHNGDKALFCKNQESLILLRTTDYEKVLNCILNGMDRYSHWNSDMITLLSSDAMLQEMFDHTESMITHPTFLLDSLQRKLALNQLYGLGSVDEQWDKLLLNGQSDLSYLLELNQNNPHRYEYHGLYSDTDPLLPNPIYSYNFFVNQNWLGQASLLDVSRNITQGELDTFTMFCGYLEQWFQMHYQEESHLLLNALLLDAIKDAGSDTSDLLQKLQLLGWETTDDLQIVRLDNSAPAFNINTHLCHTLNRNHPYIYAITVDISVCILCNITKLQEYKKLDSFLNEVTFLINISKYYAVSSLLFHMNDSFYKCYAYLDQFYKIGQPKIGQIYRGEEHIFPVFTKELRENLMPSAIHPAVNILRSYDKKHHSSLFETLFAFLKNERSPVATTKELQLHRSTLNYRLKKIAELLPYDLDNYQIRMHILLSCEIVS